MTPERYVDVSAVARKFGVSSETIRSWIRHGQLAVVMTPTGRYRVPLSAVTALILARKAQDSQE